MMALGRQKTSKELFEVLKNQGIYNATARKSLFGNIRKGLHMVIDGQQHKSISIGSKSIAYTENSQANAQ